MLLKETSTLLSYYCLHVLNAIDCVYSQSSQEMIEQGRTQYQLLQERGNLPQYGSCWKNAVVHVHEGCRSLSEESQSDIALHLANCFLQMSGHETYRCEHDKKPNLRGICINSMSDRAFNVYTEFYTHTQNICWFLQGQIWQETIAESTLKVGRQLESSARNQEDILHNQKESLQLQERMLKYGLALEKIMEDFYVSTQKHQQILGVLSSSLNNLQSWLLGEISCLDTVIFYVSAAFLTYFFTSTQRTIGARLIIFSLLTLNAFVERLINYFISRNLVQDDIRSIHGDYIAYVWISRYVCLFACLSVFILKAYYYRDYNAVNNVLLESLHGMVLIISKKVDHLNTSNDTAIDSANVSFVRETSYYNKRSSESASPCINSIDSHAYGKNVLSFNTLNGSHVDRIKSVARTRSCSKDLIENCESQKENVRVHSLNNSSRCKTSLMELQPKQYNLRSRQATPFI